MLRETVQVIESMIDNLDKLNGVDEAVSFAKEAKVTGYIESLKKDLLVSRRNLRFAESMAKEYNLTNEVKEAVEKSANAIEAFAAVTAYTLDNILIEGEGIIKGASEYKSLTDGLDRSDHRPVFASYESDLKDKYHGMLRGLPNIDESIQELREASEDLTLEIGTIINRNELYVNETKEGDKVFLKREIKVANTEFPKGSVGYINSVNNDLPGYQGVNMYLIQLGEEEVPLPEEDLGKLSDALADMYKEVPVEIEQVEFKGVVDDFVEFRDKVNSEDFRLFETYRKDKGKEFGEKEASALGYFLKQTGRGIPFEGEEKTAQEVEESGYPEDEEGYILEDYVGTIAEELADYEINGEYYYSTAEEAWRESQQAGGETVAAPLIRDDHKYIFMEAFNDERKYLEKLWMETGSEIIMNRNINKRVSSKKEGQKKTAQERYSWDFYHGDDCDSVMGFNNGYWLEHEFVGTYEEAWEVTKEIAQDEAGEGVELEESHGGEPSYSWITDWFNPETGEEIPEEIGMDTEGAEYRYQYISAHPQEETIIEGQKKEADQGQWIVEVPSRHDEFVQKTKEFMDNYAEEVMNKFNITDIGRHNSDPYGIFIVGEDAERAALYVFSLLHPDKDEELTGEFLSHIEKESMKKEAQVALGEEVYWELHDILQDFTFEGGDLESKLQENVDHILEREGIITKGEDGYPKSLIGPGQTFDVTYPEEGEHMGSIHFGFNVYPDLYNSIANGDGVVTFIPYEDESEFGSGELIEMTIYGYESEGPIESWKQGEKKTAEEGAVSEWKDEEYEDLFPYSENYYWALVQLIGWDEAIDAFELAGYEREETRGSLERIFEENEHLVEVPEMTFEEIVDGLENDNRHRLVHALTTGEKPNFPDQVVMSEKTAVDARYFFSPDFDWNEPITDPEMAADFLFAVDQDEYTYVRGFEEGLDPSMWYRWDENGIDQDPSTGVSAEGILNMANVVREEEKEYHQSSPTESSGGYMESVGKGFSEVGRYASKKEATGEPDQDYDQEFFNKIVQQLEEAGFEATHREFDKYQGVYIEVPSVDTFWVEEYFNTGEMRDEDAAKPYTGSSLEDEEGNRYSANEGDYFMYPDDHVFEGMILHLTKSDGEEVTIPNPKKSDLPDLLDVRDTFQYKPDTEAQHVILFPETKVEDEQPSVLIEVTEENGIVDASELVEYCKENTGERVASKTAKKSYVYFVSMESIDEAEDFIYGNRDSEYYNKYGNLDITLASYGPKLGVGLRFEGQDALYAAEDFAREYWGDPNKIMDISGETIASKTANATSIINSMENWIATHGVEGSVPYTKREGNWDYFLDENLVLHISYHGTEVITANFDMREVTNITTGGYSSVSTKAGISRILRQLESMGYSIPSEVVQRGIEESGLKSLKGYASKTAEFPTSDDISSDDPEYIKVMNWFKEEERPTSGVKRTPKERATIQEMIRSRKRHGAIGLEEDESILRSNIGEVFEYLDDAMTVPEEKTDPASDSFLATCVKDFFELDQPVAESLVREWRKRQKGESLKWSSKTADATKTLKQYLKEEQNAGKEYAALAEEMEGEDWLKSDIKKIRDIQTEEQRHKGILKQMLDKQKKKKEKKGEIEKEAGGWKESHRGYELEYYEEGGHNLWTLSVKAVVTDDYVWFTDDYDEIESWFESGYLDSRKPWEFIDHLIEIGSIPILEDENADLRNEYGEEIVGSKEAESEEDKKKRYEGEVKDLKEDLAALQKALQAADDDEVDGIADDIETTEAQIEDVEDKISKLSMTWTEAVDKLAVLPIIGKK